MLVFDNKLNELQMRPRDKKSYYSLTHDEVAALEHFLQAKLPEDYKAFIMKYGDSVFRGLPDVNSIQAPPKHIAGDGKPSFAAFYGSKIKDFSGLLEIVENFKGRMPNSIFSFGCDLSGNQFCLGVKGKDRGKVYLWDHENEPSEKDYTERGEPVPKNLWYQNLTLIADSFTDFINRIVITDSDE